MKSTGMTRRIDGLGRIVIPKEIRNNLNIKTTDLIEIFVDNEDIILKRNSSLKKTNDFLKRIIKIFSKNYNLDIFLTDRNKVINNNEELNTLLNDYLINNDIFISDNITNLKISNNTTLFGYIYINPIQVNGDILGLLIISKEIPFSKEDYNCINTLMKIIIEYIE